MTNSSPLRCTFLHTPDSFYATTQNYGVQFMPVWAYTLASHLDENRYHLRLYDTRRDDIGTVERADIFLFSGINQDYTYITEIHKLMKEKYPDSLFIIGGPVCWSFQMAGDIEKLMMFDHIFIGDGEETLPRFLEAHQKGEKQPQVIITSDRFPILKARPFHRPFLDSTIHRYYGAVLEVSRGCPFLCEFCDIRILPDNNRPHNKDIPLLISELEHLCELGANQVLLACDNFIGDPKWAEDFADALLAWQKKSGYRPSLYTWLTINLFKLEGLMQKLRKAGFDILFIGVESFYENSLLETAKIQNTSTGSLEEAIQKIQSYGFTIVAGLIFGFDSDPDNIFELTAKGLQETGLISGDPSVLTALPGTPLYRRMQLAGRLRNVRYGLGGYKYQTNIKYVMPVAKIVEGYKWFVEQTTNGRHQYLRLKTLFDLFDRGNYIPLESPGYGNLNRFVKMMLRSPAAIKQFLWRMFRTLRSPSRSFYLMAGISLTISRSIRHGASMFRYFQFWFFAWSNVMLKYSSLSAADFDLESVPPGFNIIDVLPTDYSSTAKEDIGQSKIDAQLRITTTQLKKLINSKS